MARASKSPPKKKNAGWESAVAGGIGAAFSRTCIAPLERLRMQMIADPGKYSGMYECISDIWKKEVRGSEYYLKFEKAIAESQDITGDRWTLAWEFYQRLPYCSPGRNSPQMTVNALSPVTHQSAIGFFCKDFYKVNGSRETHTLCLPQEDVAFAGCIVIGVGNHHDDYDVSPRPSAYPHDNHSGRLHRTNGRLQKDYCGRRVMRSLDPLALIA
eukprot:83084-Amorphochlora_amoeboformis.AAC.2